MRISIKKSSNKIFYYGLESYRDENNIVRTFTAKKFGSHDDLLKEHPDPKKWVLEQINILNNEKKAMVETFEKKIDYTIQLDNSNLDYSKSLLKNIGWLYLKQIYKELKIDEFFKGIQGKQHYNLSELYQYLVSSRIIAPDSKRLTILSQDSYLGLQNFKLQEVYKFLPIIAENENKIQSHLFKHTKEIISLNTEVLFYDCTNFYCEIEDEDEDIYALDNDEQVIQYGLRKYGASKEHRPNPIVQMGLFTDANGIPIAYDLNPGNTNEQITAKPIEKRIINDYKTSEFIYCADGGLNSNSIKLINSLNNRRYIVTQSLKKVKSKELDLMLKDINWSFLPRYDKEKKKYVDDKINLEEFKAIINKYINNEALTEDEQNKLKRDMIYKKYPMTRNVNIKDILPKGIKKDQYIEFEDMLYITFSAKYYLYELGIFNKQLLRAQNIIDTGKVNSKNVNDPKRLISQTHITKEGEVAESSLSSLDYEKVQNESNLLGIYSVATNIDCEEKNINDIIAINKKRWKIELNFRIMKSYLDTRPMYVSTDEAIRGHFSICYTALLIYSILESKMNSSTDHFKINDIILTIKNMNVIKEDEGYYKSIFTGSKTLDRLENIFNLNLNHKYFKEKRLLNL